MAALAPASVTIGTRGSTLALAQTEEVAAALRGIYPALRVDVKTITTRGDRLTDRPLHAVGGSGVFVKEIEAALREGVIDLAVHSAKDLESTMAPDLAIGAVLPRADPRDVLISRAGLRLDDLPAGARIGTSSLRRICQLRAARPELKQTPIRGNLDTRLRKLREGEVEALLLAAAGLQRLGMADLITETLPTTRFLPMAGQGALAVQVRTDDDAVRALLVPLDDYASRVALEAERSVLATIGGGCQAPVAALAHIDGAKLIIEAMIGAVDGRMVRGADAGAAADPRAAGRALAHDVLRQGGRALLAHSGAEGQVDDGG